MKMMFSSARCLLVFWVFLASQASAQDQDCEMTEFVYEPCSVTCGEGTQLATRTISKQPQGNGLQCGPLSLTIKCNGIVCPSITPTDAAIETLDGNMYLHVPVGNQIYIQEEGKDAYNLMQVAQNAASVNGPIQDALAAKLAQADFDTYESITKGTLDGLRADVNTKASQSDMEAIKGTVAGYDTATVTGNAKAIADVGNAAAIADGKVQANTNEIAKVRSEMPSTTTVGTTKNEVDRISPLVDQLIAGAELDHPDLNGTLAAEISFVGRQAAAKFPEIEGDISVLRTDLGALAGNVHSVTGRVTALEDSNFGGQINVLDNKIVTANSAISEAKADITEAEADISMLKDELADAWDAIRVLNDTVNILTVSIDPRYGNGKDGILVVPSGTTKTTECAGLAGGATAGSASIVVESCAPFSRDSQVLVHQTQHTNAAMAGVYEIAFVERTEVVSGGCALILSGGLGESFSSVGTGIQAQVTPVPQYSSASVDGVFQPPAWNGKCGGIIAFRSSGRVSVGGKISASRLGFRGAPRTVSGSDYTDGWVGESEAVAYTSLRSNNGRGSSGGAGRGQGGGHGGSHRLHGPDPTEAGCHGNIFAKPSMTIGDPDFNKVYLGASGSASGSHNGGNRDGAKGGMSGGIIFLYAKDSISTSNGGIIEANGGDGENGYYAPGANQPIGGGGGGAGGAVMLQSGGPITAVVSVNGGKGGISVNQGGCNPSGQGGAGGRGWTRILPNMAGNEPAAEPFSDFGNGMDGDVTLSGNSVEHQACHALEQDHPKGSTTMVVSGCNFMGYTLALVHQTQAGSGTPGLYEIVRVKKATLLNGGAGSVSSGLFGDSGTCTLTLAEPLQNSYKSGSFNSLSPNVAQIIPLREYSEVTISAATYARTFKGFCGGIFGFYASKALRLSNNAVLSASARGFRGAPRFPTNSDYTTGYTGESELRGYGKERSKAGVGSGGGAGVGQGAGHGGSHGTKGDPPLKFSGACDGGHVAGAGSVIGDAQFTKIFFGGSGGASGSHNGAGRDGAEGGTSGGIIFLIVKELTLGSSATIQSKGGNGVNGYKASTQPIGGGGGGAGGAIYVRTNTSPSTLTGALQVTGGDGGARETHSGCSPSGEGGAGGDGRVLVEAPQ